MRPLRQLHGKGLVKRPTLKSSRCRHGVGRARRLRRGRARKRHTQCNRSFYSGASSAK